MNADKNMQLTHLHLGLHEKAVLSNSETLCFNDRNHAYLKTEKMFRMPVSFR
jgi:hypothetical protein